MEDLNTVEDLVSSIRKKKVPILKRKASASDLCLQEFEIMNSVHSCSTLSDVNALIDKFIVYIAMAKVLG